MLKPRTWAVILSAIANPAASSGAELVFLPEDRRSVAVWSSPTLYISERCAFIDAMFALTTNTIHVLPETFQRLISDDIIGPLQRGHQRQRFTIKAATSCRISTRSDTSAIPLAKVSTFLHCRAPYTPGRLPRIKPLVGSVLVHPLFITTESFAQLILFDSAGHMAAR